MTELKEAIERSKKIILNWPHNHLWFADTSNSICCQNQESLRLVIEAAEKWLDNEETIKNNLEWMVSPFIKD